MHPVKRGAIDMHYRSMGLIGLFACLALALCPPEGALSREINSIRSDKGVAGPERVLVLDGSFVHNVGQLRMHMSNWGIFGSMPTGTLPFSFAPSAQWPAGSGVEYLYVAGIWIGAIVGGVPSVSTSAFEMEFRPTTDPIDIIYRTFEGAPAGNRYPFYGADDDGDGRFDEDRLDARDNDGDGSVDEDFGAISKQMFATWYTDDQPGITDIYPYHRPLHIKIEQESYQWDDPRFDDFVGVTLKITNTGTEVLEQVYLGCFADFDAGPRTRPNYWLDDAVNAYFGLKNTELGPAFLNVMYGYDVDGDGGLTPGYFGCMLLGHTLDPLEIKAPSEMTVSAYRAFSGSQPYENGGDPANDFQRYEVLSTHRIDRIVAAPGDYRSLMSTGPFPRLEPGESIELHFGFVAGTGLAGMLENAARCQRLFDGTWYDVDRNPLTGVDGKETQVHWVLGRPLEIEAAMDIRPGACPNPFNMNKSDIAPSDNPQKGGVLPVAILGAANFDVRDVVRSSVRLEGIAPLFDKKPHYEDVSRPASSAEPCACATEGRDGYPDLLLKFSDREIALAIESAGAPARGGTYTLTLTGALSDGTPFRAEDCVVLVGMPDPKPDDRPDDRPNDKPGDRRRKPELLAASPNPFNPTMSVEYYLPERQRVKISVFDASGRMAAVLVDGVQSAGDHVARWQASGFSSGIYFCRLEAAGVVSTKKIVLLRQPGSGEERREEPREHDSVEGARAADADDSGAAVRDPAQVEQVRTHERAEDPRRERDRRRELPHEHETARGRRERGGERRKHDPDVRHGAGEPEADRGVDRDRGRGDPERSGSALRDPRQLVGDDHARNHASADVDGDDGRGGLPEQLREDASGAVEPERRRIDRHDPGNSLERNVEEPPDEHGDHDREGRPGAQSELGQRRRHRVGEEDGEQDRERDDEQERQAPERHDSKHDMISPAKGSTPRGAPRGVEVRERPQIDTIDPRARALS
jgi:hypothetical protein